MAARRGDPAVVPPHPAADDVGQVGENGVPCRLGDLRVEGVVGGDGAGHVVGFGGGVALLPDRPQPGHPLRRRHAGREAGGLGLQQLTHVEQLIDLLVGGHVHEGALAGAQVHPALGFQAVQRLPDRLPADAELAGQLGFHKMLARPEIAADDEIDQRVVDRLTQRDRPRQGADRRRSRLRGLRHLAYSLVRCGLGNASSI
jgi:hypothetical protein